MYQGGYPAPMNQEMLTWLPAPHSVSIGVDGCKGGWLVATIEDGSLEFNLVRDLSPLFENTQARVLVDMPMGLPAHERRLCDLEARALLGHRRSTLFPVATRAALYAPTYHECCEVNARLQGCRVSKQLWNLSAKIRHLDTIVRARADLHERVAEGHPELAFLRCSSNSAALPSKGTPEGLHRRVSVIDQLLSTNVRDLIDPFLSHHARNATVVDCLDAAVLALFLFKGQGGVAFLGDGAQDEFGIPMRIASAPQGIGISGALLRPEE